MGKTRNTSWCLALVAVATALVALLPASAAMSTTSGLVAAYGFEAGSGTLAADTSGNGNDGTIAHASWTSSGAYGHALQLDGSAVAVVVPDSPTLHLRHAMTLEAWVKPVTVSSAARDVVYKGDNDYFLQATTSQNGAPGGGGDFTGSGRTWAVGTTPLVAGAWSHVAVTYDGAALRLYVNGDEVASVPEDGTMKSSAKALELGGDDTFGQYFEGVVDEVRVYDVARSGGEIAGDMTSPVVPGTPGDVLSPSAPGTLSATAAGSGEVDLSWGDASDNVGVTGYEVFRCQGDGCSDFARVAQVDAATNRYADSGLAAGTTYSYHVRAVDAAGNTGDFSNTASATTAVRGDAEPPSAPGTLSATVVSSGEVGLSWGAATDSSSVTYEVERCQGSGCTDFAPVGTTAATEFSDTSVSADTTYVYRVRAVDAAGNVGAYSNSADATTPSVADTEPPSVPGTLVATVVSSADVDLTWGAARDASSVIYDLQRCQGSGCTDFAPVGTTAATEFSDISVSASTTYVYRVRAVDAVGNSGDFSNTAEVTTPAVPDTEPPSAPGTLVATAVSSGEVDLSWGAATDSSSVVYDVQRCQGSGCTDIAPLAVAATTEYRDTSVSADTTYVYRVRAVDAAGNVGPYSNTAAATTAPAPSGGGPGPLSVDPSGRYLVDQNGKPFLMMGDSPQALIGDLTESDAERYFADRRAKGFNTVWINLLCNNYTGCEPDGATWDGVLPFTTPGDFSTPNEAYFGHVDRILRLAGQYGLIVVLDPAETGGWLGTMESNGVDKLRAYGQYLGRRYRDFPNIIWMHGNDFQNYGPSTDPYVIAVAEGIRDVDTTHLQTVELNYGTSGSLDDPTWEPLIQLNASYTYNPTYEQVLKDYNRSNFLPVFMVEANYEFEQNSTPPGGTTKYLRQQEYWTMLSGATGQLYGNHYTWQFLCWNRDAAGNCYAGWPDYLDTPGQTQFGYLKQLFESRRWFDLVPDQAHAVVTDGLGTYGTNDYVTAARTPDGKLAMAYMPSARTITVDLSTFSGPVTARWYDPTTGTFTGATPLLNVGSRQFTTPEANAGGDDDWVLVLETA